MGNIVIEYACDGNGNHKTPVSECIRSEKKEFNNSSDAKKFIDECSYVYNIDELNKTLSNNEILQTQKVK